MKITKSLTLPFLGLFAATGILPLASCGEEEVATGAAVVAVGAAVAAHLDDDDDDDDWDRRRRRRCHDYWDYRGRRHEECYRYDRHQPRAARPLTPEQLRDTPVPQVITAEELASTYLLSVAKARIFLDAMERSRRGDIDAIIGLGFTEDDVEAMSQMRLRGIARASIDRMAQHLDQRREMTEGMVARMINHAYALQRELEQREGRERF
jgi:hypothetical protein